MFLHAVLAYVPTKGYKSMYQLARLLGLKNNSISIIANRRKAIYLIKLQLHMTIPYAGELGYDGPLYDRFLHMTDNMLGPSLMHIKYSSYVYDQFSWSH